MSLQNVNHLTIDRKDAIRLEVIGGTVWKGLPKGYKRLAYIETTGTQWVDLEFVPNQDSRVVCKFVRLGGDGIWGTRYSTASRNFNMRGISGNFQAGYGATLKSTDVPLDTKWHIVDQNKNICSLDGVVVAEFEYANFTAPKSIALGGINANNKFYYGEGRYSDTQVYDNGVLVRDVIPCEDPDGNIGMYDTVNAKFRGNAGTGTFVAGPEV
jgi:hypothetical protein